MYSKIATAFALVGAVAAAPQYYSTTTAAAAPAATSAAAGSSGSISVTPHESFSSSIGVLGCLIDINRVAYWPGMPTCGSMCKKITTDKGSVTVLHIDSSGGAHDISYDAWNILNSGQGALENPTYGGGIDATYETVPMSECADIIKTDDGKLPLQAANAVNFYTSCPSETSLYNVANSACTLGYLEKCTMPDATVSNQPQCPHTLGLQTALTGHTVYNLEYDTATKVVSKVAIVQ